MADDRRGGPLERAGSDWAALLGPLLEAASEPLERLTGACVGAIRRGGAILFAGNGGSAAQCQHLAAELVVRLDGDREAYPAVALVADTSVLTAAGNDLGFDRVFARQVEAVGRDGDVLVLLSANGRSPNVLVAADAARRRGLTSWAWTGRRGSDLAERCDGAIVVPSGDVARIQEAHLLLGHALCAGIESALEEASPSGPRGGSGR